MNETEESIDVVPVEARTAPLRQHSRAVNVLRFLHKWLIVIPFVGISTAIICSIIIVLAILGMPDFAGRVFGRLWARLNLGASLVRVAVSGREHVVPGQSYVIAANHQSLYDIYVLYGHGDLDIKWVMKKELRSVPFLGLACEKIGHIIIDRSDRESALSTINRAKERICNGTSVIFFPEGTRSRDGKLLRFKSGAFVLAIDLQIPILPVSIHGSRDVLPSDTMDLTPGTIRMEFHEPIGTEGLDQKAARELANRTRAVLERALARDP